MVGCNVGKTANRLVSNNFLQISPEFSSDLEGF